MLLIKKGRPSQPAKPQQQKNADPDKPKQNPNITRLHTIALIQNRLASKAQRIRQSHQRGIPAAGNLDAGHPVIGVQNRLEQEIPLAAVDGQIRPGTFLPRNLPAEPRGSRLHIQIRPDMLHTPAEGRNLHIIDLLLILPDRVHNNTSKKMHTEKPGNIPFPGPVFSSYTFR